jgi:hypothetical protein
LSLSRVVVRRFLQVSPVNPHRRACLLPGSSHSLDLSAAACALHGLASETVCCDFLVFPCFPPSSLRLSLARTTLKRSLLSDHRPPRPSQCSSSAHQLSPFPHILPPTFIAARSIRVDDRSSRRCDNGGSVKKARQGHSAVSRSVCVSDGLRPLLMERRDLEALPTRGSRSGRAQTRSEAPDVSGALRYSSRAGASPTFSTFCGVGICEVELRGAPFLRSCTTMPGADRISPLTGGDHANHAQTEEMVLLFLFATSAHFPPFLPSFSGRQLLPFFLRSLARRTQPWHLSKVDTTTLPPLPTRKTSFTPMSSLLPPPSLAPRPLVLHAHPPELQAPPLEAHDAPRSTSLRAASLPTPRRKRNCRRSWRRRML